MVTVKYKQLQKKLRAKKPNECAGGANSVVGHGELLDFDREARLREFFDRLLRRAFGLRGGMGLALLRAFFPESARESIAARFRLAAGLAVPPLEFAAPPKIINRLGEVKGRSVSRRRLDNFFRPYVMRGRFGTRDKNCSVNCNERN